MAQSFDESTIGGRIRKSRIDAALSIQELAQKVGVSGNHLSLVERGIKNPSITLMRKIAETTNVPYSWIQNGSEDKDKSQDVMPSENPLLVKNINVPIFLSLALQKIPGMTKSKLAGRLDVEDGDIDRILSGESINFPQRALKLSYIVQQMNLDKARQELHTLDQFLQQEGRHRSQILLDMLKFHVEHVGKEYNRVFALFSDNIDPESLVPINGNVTYQKAGPSGITSWYFRIYHCLTDDNPDLISQIITEQLTSPEKMGKNAKLSFVLCDEKVFAQFQESCKKFISENENAQFRTNVPDISFIFGDIVNREIKEARLSDSDDPGNDTAL